MKKVFLVVFGALIFGACSESKPTISETVEVKSEEEKPAVVSNKKLTLDIEGMSCEMGCGGAIRKELFATNAVERVKFDFKMGRDVNTAEIFYDATKIQDKEISKIISEINDQQFKVGNESVNDFEASKEEKSVGTTHSKNTSSKQYTSLKSSENLGFKKVNLLDLLVSTLFRK